MIRAGFFIGVIMPETRKYTAVDLFAGVGGLSYGFSRNEHYEIILANEMQKDIAKAYTLNHPSVNMLHRLCMWMTTTKPSMRRQRKASR